MPQLYISMRDGVGWEVEEEVPRVVFAMPALRNFSGNNAPLISSRNSATFASVWPLSSPSLLPSPLNRQSRTTPPNRPPTRPLLTSSASREERSSPSLFPIISVRPTFSTASAEPNCRLLLRSRSYLSVWIKSTNAVDTAVTAPRSS